MNHEWKLNHTNREFVIDSRLIEITQHESLVTASILPSDEVTIHDW